MSIDAEPFLIAAALLCFWLIASVVASYMSGWLSLAKTFRVDELPEGEWILRQVTQIGDFPEKGVTSLNISHHGLGLYANTLFRFMRPTILVPWTQVSDPEESTFLWRTSYKYDLAGTASIRVKQEAYETIERLRPSRFRSR